MQTIFIFLDAINRLTALVQIRNINVTVGKKY